MLTKTPSMQLFELQKRRPLDEMIVELYNRGLSRSQVAAALGVNVYTLRLWERRLGIRKQYTSAGSIG